MKVLKHLFENNRRWAANRIKNDPDFFKRLVSQQSPEYLWIGCSDSRVPANEIVGLHPGELFVHRNVANLVVDNDLNCQSVIHFAVEVLKVKHVIVCGHYGCGGVKAILDNSHLGLVDDWLETIKIIRDKNSVQLNSLKEPSIIFNKLCELNVIEQVLNVCKIDVIKKSWKDRKSLSVHGWIYDIKDGLLQDLDVCISNTDEVDEIKSKALSKIFFKD